MTTTSGTTGTNTLDSTDGLTSGSTLTNQGAKGTTQVVGLSSGINTDELIQAELAVEEEPMTMMQDEITGLGTEDNTLSEIQADVQVVSLDAEALAEPSLFFNQQTISSSDSTLVSAATTDGPGAVVGSSTISVNSLASAAQRTFNYTAPTSNDTMTIDGQQVTISAGQSAQSLAEQINGEDSLDVWATTSVGEDGATQLVLSSRTTGNNDNSAGTYISVVDNVTVNDDGSTSGGTQVSGSGGTASSVFSEDTGLAQEGTDAAYSINGGPTQYSTTDTVSNALPGVTLTLSGVTGSTPVTITANTPGPDTTAIVSAIEQFVVDYNAMVTTLESAINTAPASESNVGDYNPNSGSLFGDDELEELLNNMRTSLYTPGSGLPTGLAAMTDLGISTGASTGTATSSGIDGELTIDFSTLESEIGSNPSGVQSVLNTFAESFQTLANQSAGPAGTIEDRISGNSNLVSTLQTQYSSMQYMFQQEEATMEEYWANVESTLGDLDDQKTTFSSFTNSLSSSTSSSSSSS